ncbi:MAG: hypothetical protein WC789_14050 [Lentisphaeria bacterium]|jgi:type IV pilus assembly protein PilQ
MQKQLLGLLPLLLLTVSCRHLAPESPPAAATPEAMERQLKLERAAEDRRTLEQATALLADARLDEAAALAQGLLAGGSPCAVDAGHLLAEAERRRAVNAQSRYPSLSENLALGEVTERGRLPATYGQTLVIAKGRDLQEVPAGPMEKLVNKPVSMQLENASVRDIVMELSKVDGLNIVADQALTGDAAAGGPAALTIQVKDVPLREVLSYIARNLGIAFYLSDNVVWVSKADPSLAGPQLETQIYRIQRGFIPEGVAASDGAAAAGGGAQPAGGGGGGGGSDDELQVALDTALAQSPQGASISIFRSRNLLLVRNTRENLRLVEKILKEFDQEPKQVLIESRFVTVSQKELKELGTKINSLKMSKAAGSDEWVTSLVAGNKFPVGQLDATGTSVTLAGILGEYSYEAVLAALDNMSTSKTLSAPRLTVLNNHSASIHKGRDLYYWEEWEADTNTVTTDGSTYPVANPRPSGTPTREKLGITLDVKVSVGNDGKTVMLALAPKVSSLQGFFTYGTSNNPDPGAGGNGTTPPPADGGTQVVGYQLPVIQESSVTTAVAVKSGETVVLGGTLENTDEVKVEKVPFLGDIPLLGWLFKHKSRRAEPEHLLIFVTAKVISGSGEFVEVREPQ